MQGAESQRQHICKGSAGANRRAGLRLQIPSAIWQRLHPRTTSSRSRSLRFSVVSLARLPKGVRGLANAPFNTAGKVWIRRIVVWFVEARVIGQKSVLPRRDLLRPEIHRRPPPRSQRQQHLLLLLPAQGRFEWMSACSAT